MNIWGKLIGGATGFAIGGPIGGLLGTLAGHAIDSKIIPKYINVKNNYESIVFTAGVIALSAKMAKADGQVTKEEILTFRKFVQIPKGILMKLVSYGNWPKKQQMAMNFMQDKFIILLRTKVKY